MEGGPQGSGVERRVGRTSTTTIPASAKLRMGLCTSSKHASPYLLTSCHYSALILILNTDDTGDRRARASFPTVLPPTPPSIDFTSEAEHIAFVA
jgi:hypothetical protein